MICTFRLTEKRQLRHLGLLQIADAQYGEVAPPSPSPPPSYYGRCPTCDHYGGYPESPSHVASSPSLEQSASSSPYQPASGPVPPAPQKAQATSVILSSTQTPHSSLIITDEWLTTTESLDLSTEIPSASLETHPTESSTISSPSIIFRTSSKFNLETSQVTLKASSTTEILKEEHSSTNAIPLSSTTTSKNVQSTFSTQPPQHQRDQEIVSCE